MQLAAGRYIRLPDITCLQYKELKFVIMNAPKPNTVTKFAEELTNLNVKEIVRVCEPTYETNEFTAMNMNVHDFEFSDGSAPPREIIQKWLVLLKNTFYEADGQVKLAGPVAVHCLAGLGRAPVLVAIALMERGMFKEDVIDFIRQKRRNAFNSSQLEYLTQYNSKNQLKRSKLACYQYHLSRFLRCSSST